MQWTGSGPTSADTGGPTPVLEPPGQDGPAILVVDDDPVQRLLISATLKKHGFRVAQASDGAAAFDRLTRGEECALLLTDLHMPRMDGDELVRRLRASPLTAALPIVILTGSGGTERESQLTQFGADGFIRKPVDPARLLANVRAALRMPS